MDETLDDLKGQIGKMGERENRTEECGGMSSWPERKSNSQCDREARGQAVRRGRAEDGAKQKERPEERKADTLSRPREGDRRARTGVD